MWRINKISLTVAKEVNAMKPVLFRGASIWDGSGAAAFPGDVLVEGSRIKAVAPAPERLSVNGATVIEARDST
jgi:hypothetical protein